MIPVFDRPPIHFSVQEASESGIDHITLVASEGQESILKYFDKRPDLEEAVTNRKNPEMLELLREIPDMADISVVIQKEQLGLGHAILQARKTIGEQDFAILLPDDLILSNRPTIGEMCSIAEETNNMVLAVREVEEEAVPNLGIVNQGNDFGNTVEVLGMVEKPSLETAPSNMAIIGRYVLPAEIFEAIQNTPPGSLGEIQLTDGIIALLNTFDCTGYKFTGTHFDVGTPFGMLNASLHIAKTQFGFDIKK